MHRESAFIGVRLQRAIDSLCGAACFAVPVVICAVWGQHYVQFWDTGESQTVPYILGIAHPTGFPAYVLLGFLFTHIVVIGSVAFRMSLFSGCCAGVACAALYVSLRALSANAIAALLATLALAFGTIVVKYAIRAEVHTLALAFESLALLEIFRWVCSRRQYDLFLACVFEGLALATHPVALWLLPGMAVIVAVHYRRLTRAAVAYAAAALLSPLLLYLYLPIRSAVVTNEHLDPALRIGLPPGQPFWDYGHAIVWRNFIWMISGSQFDKGAGLAGFYQFERYPEFFSKFSNVATEQFGSLVVVFALIGIVALWRKDRALAIGTILCGIAFLPFAFAYAEETDQVRYVLEALWINALLVGLGLQEVLAILSRLRVGIREAAIVAALFVVSLQVWQDGWPYRPESVVARDFVRRVASVTPDDAVLVAPWVYVTPLGYSAYVAHDLGNRLLFNTHIEGSVATIEGLAGRYPTYVVLQKTRVPGLDLRLVSRGDPEILRVVPSARLKRR